MRYTKTIVRLEFELRVSRTLTQIRFYLVYFNKDEQY